MVMASQQSCSVNAVPVEIPHLQRPNLYIAELLMLEADINNDRCRPKALDSGFMTAANL